MIWIPETTWEQMLDRLAQTPAGLERVAYLDGVRITDRAGCRHGVVTTVTIPDATLTSGSYGVSADAMGAAGEHLFSYGLMRLAQVHSHGNHDTRHSPVDDGRAYSQQDDSLSLVLPFHGARRPKPVDTGVHVRDADGWHLLSPAETDKLIRLVPALVDQRPALTPIDQAPTKRGIWSWLPHFLLRDQPVAMAKRNRQPR